MAKQKPLNGREFSWESYKRMSPENRQRVRDHLKHSGFLFEWAQVTTDVQPSGISDIFEWQDGLAVRYSNEPGIALELTVACVDRIALSRDPEKRLGYLHLRNRGLNPDECEVRNYMDKYARLNHKPF